MHSSRMRTVRCSGRPWGWRGNLPGGVCTVGLSACQGGGVCPGGGGYLPRGCSSGSSSQVRGVAEKHEIYAAVKGGHLFYDLFLQGWGGGHGPLGPPGSATGGLPARVLGVSACWGVSTQRGVCLPGGYLPARGVRVCQTPLWTE